MNIAQRLRTLMESQKLSRSKLARELGVHTSTVSRWLDGKDVNTENLESLCKYFNCSLDYLADATGTKNAPTQDGEREIDDRKMKVSFFGGLADGLSDEKIDEYYDDARSYIGYKIMRDKEQGNKPD